MAVKKNVGKRDAENTVVDTDFDKQIVISRVQVAA